MNVLILEDNETHTFILYRVLAEHYANINCYPVIDYGREESVMMTEFIDRCAAFRNNPNDASIRQELVRFIREEALQDKKPDLFIIDMKLDEKKQWIKDTGGYVRKHILAEEFPGVPAVFWTAYDEDDNVKPFMSVNDKHRSKFRLGASNLEDFFKEGFEDICRELGLPVNKRTSTEKKNGWDHPVLNTLKKNAGYAKKEPGPTFARAIVKILSVFVLLGCIGFMITLCSVLFMIVFYHDAHEKLRLMVGELLQGVEIMFISILPLIIMTSFYLYYKNITMRYINPDLDDMKTVKGKKEAHYYLNFSKILFISTLMSLVATKFLEGIDFASANTEQEGAHIDKGLLLIKIGAAFAFFLMLLLFYRFIEKGLHSLGKEIDNETD